MATAGLARAQETPTSQQLSLPLGMVAGKTLPAETMGAYEGELRDGVPDGFGRFEGRLPSGKPYVYVGTWKQGRFDGYGELTDGDTLHFGHFKAGLRHGSGVLSIPNGSVYEGEFSAGLMHGLGIWRLTNGEAREGRFESGRIVGDASRTANGRTYYRGDDDKRGMRHGQGITLMGSIAAYRGTYVDNKGTGRGELMYSNGMRLVGDFVDSVPVGVSMLRSASGTSYLALFDRDQRVMEVDLGKIDPTQRPRACGAFADWILLQGQCIGGVPRPDNELLALLNPADLTVYRQRPQSAGSVGELYSFDHGVLIVGAVTAPLQFTHAKVSRASGIAPGAKSDGKLLPMELVYDGPMQGLVPHGSGRCRNMQAAMAPCTVERGELAKGAR